MPAPLLYTKNQYGQNVQCSQRVEKNNKEFWRGPPRPTGRRSRVAAVAVWDPLWYLCGSDHCSRILLSCFRARISASFPPLVLVVKDHSKWSHFWDFLASGKANDCALTDGGLVIMFSGIRVIQFLIHITGFICWSDNDNPATVTVVLWSEKWSSYTDNHRIEWQSLTVTPFRFPSTVTVTDRACIFNHPQSCLDTWPGGGDLPRNYFPASSVPPPTFGQPAVCPLRVRRLLLAMANVFTELKFTLLLCICIFLGWYSVASRACSQLFFSRFLDLSHILYENLLLEITNCLI